MSNQIEDAIDVVNKGFEYPKNETISVKLPQCCIDVRDDCPHVAKKKKDKKVNIGL